MDTDAYIFPYKGKMVTIVFRTDENGNFGGWDAICEGWSLTKLPPEELQKLGFLRSDMISINEIVTNRLLGRIAQ